MPTPADKQSVRRLRREALAPMYGPAATLPPDRQARLPETGGRQSLLGACLCQATPLCHWHGSVRQMRGRPRLAAHEVHPGIPATRARRLAQGRRVCHRPLDRRQADAGLPALRCRKAKTAARGVHHGDRGSQYAAGRYREALAEHGLVGSRGRRGNPSDRAKAESFMKTLKVEAVDQWPTRPSRTSLPTFHASSIRSATPVDCTPLGYLSP